MARKTKKSGLKAKEAKHRANAILQRGCRLVSKKAAKSEWFMLLKSLAFIKAPSS